MISGDLQNNFELFRDCLSGPLVQRLAVDRNESSGKRKPKGRKRHLKDVGHEPGTMTSGSSAEELEDFVDVRPI